MRFQGYTIVTDMDGTLLNSKGKLSEENIAAIKEFTGQGGKFTVATGRMLPSVKRFVDRLNINLPAILYNGTKIYDFETGETIFEVFLEENRKQVIKKILKERPSLGIEVYAEETVYIYNPCKYTERFSKSGYDVIYEINEDLFNKNWAKVLIIGEKEEIDLLEEIYQNQYDNGPIVRTGDRYLELAPFNTSKGHALGILCNKLDIDRDRLITFGDNMNDSELLTVGALGFCVENGSERLKRETVHIAPSNDNHIIDYAIKNIINLERLPIKQR